MLKSIKSIFTFSTSSSATSIEQNSPEEQIIPTKYIECQTKNQKIRWIQSDHGQLVLSHRPVLLEYYKTGYLFKIVDNPHWKIRLEEWLDWSEDEVSNKNVPYGLSLPLTEEEKEKVRQDYLTPMFKNPPLESVFGSTYEMFKDCELPIENRFELLTDGFTVLRQVVPLDLVERADWAINDMIQQAKLHEFDVQKATKGPLKSKMNPDAHNQDPFFLSGGTNNLDVLSMFYSSPVHAMTENLLHNDKPENRKFRASIHGCQIAYRFSQPGNPPVDGKLGGLRWHVDGLDRGKYGSFSFLIGFAINDQCGEYSGNLCLHPGSHYGLIPYLREYAHLCAGAESFDERVIISKLPRPKLEEPVQVKVNAGDVVIALHKVAHFGGPNYSPYIRKMCYFRVSHRQHDTLRYDSFDNIWIEYEGMHDIL